MSSLFLLLVAIGVTPYSYNYIAIGLSLAELINTFEILIYRGGNDMKTNHSTTTKLRRVWNLGWW